MSKVIHFPLGSNQARPPLEDRDWATSQELVAAAGITYRQFDYWSRTGLLTSIADRTQSGYLRRYSRDQVARACAIKELLDAGVSLQTIRAHIDEYLEHGRLVIGAVTITHTQENQ